MKTFIFSDARSVRRDESLVVLATLFLSLAGLPVIWALWPKLFWLLR
jgi:NADH:ubiquinone oxidoreductase subunit 2 (subunit N)